MTETSPTLHLDPSPSGGSSGAAPEHLPARGRGAPQTGDRGRQRDRDRDRQMDQRDQQRQQRQRAGSTGTDTHTNTHTDLHTDTHTNTDPDTDPRWQTEAGLRGVCPASAPGNLLKSPVTVQPQRGDKNGEDRPLDPTPNPTLDPTPNPNLNPNLNPTLNPTLDPSLDQVREESLLIDSDTGFDPRLGKKRHRRRPNRKKRTWKPYYKLSWEERRVLEEKETARASRLREEMFAKGLPVAPYNTTQFLMDEHDREEPDLNTETGVRRPSGVGGRMEDTGSEEDLFEHEEEEEDEGSGGGSDGIGRAGSAGGEFLQRDFSETYEMYHVESLQNMSKQELVQEYLELEKCMSRLEEENNRLRGALEPGGLTLESSLVRLRELERELERLRAQNTELLLQRDRAQ